MYICISRRFMDTPSYIRPEMLKRRSRGKSAERTDRTDDVEAALCSCDWYQCD